MNKRLLMRILAHLEQKDLDTLHDEVAALDAAFRATVGPAMDVPVEEEDGASQRPEVPVKAGDLPVGREEERRGHALPNKENTPSGRKGNVLGRDQETRSDTDTSTSAPSG